MSEEFNWFNLIESAIDIYHIFKGDEIIVVLKQATPQELKNLADILEIKSINIYDIVNAIKHYSKNIFERITDKDVSYADVVFKVADKLNIQYYKGLDTLEDIELKILQLVNQNLNENKMQIQNILPKNNSAILHSIISLSSGIIPPLQYIDAILDIITLVNTKLIFPYISPNYEVLTKAITYIALLRIKNKQQTNYNQ